MDGFDTGFRDQGTRNRDRNRDRPFDTKGQNDNDGIRGFDRQSFNDGDPGDCAADGLESTYEKVKCLKWPKIP